MHKLKAHRSITISTYSAVLLLALLLVAACSSVQPDNSVQAQGEATVTPIPTAPAVARPLYIVQRGDVQDTLEFSGRWQPRDQMQLTFEIAGTVRRVNVQRGDTVTAGQLLADFQITDLENQLAQAQLDLESAQTRLLSGTGSEAQTVQGAQVALANAQINLDSTKNGSPWASVESARLNVQSAQTAVDNAQRAYEDALSHPEQPASAVDNALQALQNAKNQLLSAQASYDSAAQQYNNYQYQIQQAENGVVKAQLDLENAENGVGNVEGEQSVRSAQLKIDQINGQIAQSSLYAPIDGVVIEVTIKPGDQVQAFKSVITMGIPEPKEAIASLAINDAQRLSVGMVGVCQVVNHPETAVQCAVRQIPQSSRDVDQTTRVAASLEDVADGQLIDIQMPLQVSQNVLWLPPAAIRTFQNRTFVVLDTPDGPRPVDVQLGLQTDDRVEIVSGVNEGDVVQAP
jgi:HlyD family secretion protein